MEVKFNVIPVFTGIEHYAILNDNLTKRYLFELYSTARNDFVEIFNEKIDDINNKWDALVQNEHIPEDDNAAPNSRYNKFVKKHFETDLRQFNNDLPLPIKTVIMLDLDEECNIIGRLTLANDVTINMLLKEV